MLQIDITTKTQARILLWAVWLLMLGLMGLAIALVVLRNDLRDKRDPQKGAYYVTCLALAAACVVAVSVQGGVFVLRCRREAQRKRHW